MPQISIVVPVYKVEKYIHRCIDSILAQTFADFELILVDDGSPDRCGEICEEYAAKDSRIRVIHQKNSGAAAARNAGLDAARGDYVAFCDSDDLVSQKWLERLHAYAAPDVIPMGAYCADPAELGGRKVLSIPDSEIQPVSDYFRFYQCGISGYLCNALYCNEIIQTHHLRLRTQHHKGDYNEDLLFALQYQTHIRKIVYTGYADYLYDTREGSLSRSYSNHYFDKYEEKYLLWRQFLEAYSLEEQKIDLAGMMLYRFLTALNHANFQETKRIVASDAVQEAVRLADTPAENPQIIRLIQKKAALPLWLRLQIHHLKGRFL